MKQKCPADCELKDGYGMTEVPLITRTKQEGSKPGSAGKLVSNVMAKVVDLDTNKSVGPNESGELLVKGTTTFKGVSDLEAIMDYFAFTGKSCENLNFCFPGLTA